MQSHPIQQATIDAEAEVARFTTEHTRGIVLRMGSLYGPEAPSALEQLSMARKGFAALPGLRDAYISSIWTEDSARAILIALAEAPAGVYDIVDDEPLTRADFATALARSVGKRRLLRIPNSLMNLLAGSAADMANRSQRVSNRRFRELTTWKPTVSSAQKGWDLIAQADHTAERV